MKDVNKKFTVRYYLNLVLIDEEDRRYFKQQVRRIQVLCGVYAFKNKTKTVSGFSVAILIEGLKLTQI